MNKPTVSVIIIFFNAEIFLEEAIKSVLGQTIDDCELLLIDDGSTDNSSFISKKYVENFPGKIHYFEHNNHINKGMSASRNLGLKHSKGKYITFLDADDIYLPNRLEEHKKIFEKYSDISCIFGATKIWFSWDRSTKKKDYIQKLNVPSKVYQPGEFFKLLITNKAAVPSICSITVKRDSLSHIGLFEKKFKGMFEDLVFSSKVSLKVSCYVDNNSYALYRRHGDSHYQKAITDKTIKKYTENYLNWLFEFVNEDEKTDDSVINIIKKRLWLNDHPFINYIHRRIRKQWRKFFPVKK